MGRSASIIQALPGARRIVRALWPEISAQRRILAGAMLALLFEVGFRLLEPWPLKFVFDEVLGTGRNAPRLPLIGRADPETVILIAALLVVLFTGLRAGAAYLGTVGLALAGNRMVNDVRNRLYGHLQQLSLRFHSRSRGGDIVVRVIGDIGMVRDVAVTAMMPFAANTLVLLGMFVVMFFVNVELTLISLAALPLFFLAAVRRSRRIQDVSRKQREREGAVAATAAESMGAIKVVQALSLEAKFREQFEGQARKSLREGVRGARLAAGLERTVDLLIALATAVVLWRGAVLSLAGVLTPGDLIVFLTYLRSAFKPVRDFAKYTGRIAKASAAGERIVDVLEQVPEVVDRPGAVPAPRFAGDIRFENVSFEYEPEVPVLRGVDLHIQAGGTLSLVGPSGHGKSTLVSLVLRLHDPTKGRILIDGRDITEFTLASLRSQVIVLLQEPLLFRATIAENIAFGGSIEDRSAIGAVADLANVSSFVERLPDRFDTIVGERGVTLSQGQRQRIAIARAMLRNAPIILLDEPTTGLDDVNARAVTEALDRLCMGRTTIVISHDLEYASRADRIAYVEHGRIAELGDHEELVRLGAGYARIWQARPRGQRSSGGIGRVA